MHLPDNVTTRNSRQQQLWLVCLVVLHYFWNEDGANIRIAEQLHKDVHLYDTSSANYKYKFVSAVCVSVGQSVWLVNRFLGFCRVSHGQCDNASWYCTVRCSPAAAQWEPLNVATECSWTTWCVSGHSCECVVCMEMFALWPTCDVKVRASLSHFLWNH